MLSISFFSKTLIFAFNETFSRSRTLFKASSLSDTREGRRRKGRERKGREGKGREAKGSRRKGSEGKGKERKETEGKGREGEIKPKEGRKEIVADNNVRI